MGCRPEYGGTALVVDDDPIKLLQFVRLVGRNAELFDLECSRVAQGLAHHFSLALITCEAIVDVDWSGQVVELETRWNRDLEDVGVALRAFRN